MSIVVELGSETEQRLRNEAAVRGMSLQDYVAELIRQAAQPLPNERPTLAEFEVDWAAFADGLDHLAPLPERAFSREAIYGDTE